MPTAVRDPMGMGDLASVGIFDISLRSLVRNAG